MEHAKNINVYEENGKYYFEDSQEKIELTENVSADDIYWNDDNGYVLADGRNLMDIAK